MKRRDLFKMLATLAAVPFAAPLTALCKPKRIVPFVASPEEAAASKTYEPPVQKVVNVEDWSMNPIAKAAGHVKHPPSKWETFWPLDGRIPRYEGVVYGSGGTRMWRFDAVSGIHFECHQCGTVLAFSRDDFREHGQKCNFVFGSTS